MHHKIYITLGNISGQYMFHCSFDFICYLSSYPILIHQEISTKLYFILHYINTTSFQALIMVSFYFDIGFRIHSKKMQAEREYAHTLFAVVGLFFVGHLFRILLDLVEFYKVCVSYDEPYVDKDCNRTCASNFPLWTHVSIPHLNIP